MQIKLFLGLFITLVGEVAFAQQTLPILKTNTTTLDFKERGILKKGEWQLVADIELDIYEVSNKNIEQVITIYSDIDSLSITLMPNSVFDFIILLKNQTPFKTRISSRYNTYRKNCNNCVITSDTIPFKYGKGNRILIKGKINDGEDLDFLFDTGAEFIGLYQSGAKKNPNLLFNRTGVAIGGGGQFETKISDANKLSISNLIWDNKAIYYSGEKLGNYDGVMGYKIFEDKVVEINFDQDIIIAHSSLPAIEQGYTKCRFEKRGELFFIELKLKIGDKTVAEWFDFDTGNTGNINIHDEFATKENLFGLLKKIGESTVKGADGAKRKTDEVILSKVHFGDYEFTDIPIFIEQPSKVENLPFPIVGIELISRFNVIMDYKNNCIYLKPNKYFLKSFKKKDNTTMNLIVGLLIAIILLAGLFLMYKKRKKIIQFYFLNIKINSEKNMKYLKIYLLLITIILAFLTSCSTTKNTYTITKNYKPDDKKLYETIVKLDSTFFGTYNTCNTNLEKYASFFSENIEFYHDQGGLMTSKQDIIEATRRNICGKVTRDLVKGSIEVYPIKGFGAIEIGLHKFHNNQEPVGTPSKIGRFMVIWQNKNNEWKIIRVVSLH